MHLTLRAVIALSTPLDPLEGWGLRSCRPDKRSRNKLVRTWRMNFRKLLKKVVQLLEIHPVSERSLETLSPQKLLKTLRLSGRNPCFLYQIFSQLPNHRFNLIWHKTPFVGFLELFYIKFKLCQKFCTSDYCGSFGSQNL